VQYAIWQICKNLFMHPSLLVNVASDLLVN
jgi:hypothetical protein